MFASLLIVALEALILAVIWQWDARQRRAARHRHHAEKLGAGAGD